MVCVKHKNNILRNNICSKKNMITEYIYQEYLKTLLQGDRNKCRNTIQELLNNNIEVRILYENLFSRSLYDVGYLWEKNKISVAIEHLCTAITESLITMTYPYLFSAKHNGKKVVVTCTPGEFHQIGARMVADFFEIYGWDSYFLGANTPETVLYNYIDDTKPDLIAISISVNFNMHILEKLVININQKFPNLEILLGGQAFRWGGQEIFQQNPRIKILENLSQLSNNI